MSTLPPPHPEQGSAAAQKANAVRSNAVDALKAGDLDLSGLFQQVRDEGPEHVLGHMHLRAALLALPHIGEKRAFDICDQLGLDAHRHLDTLGSHERQAVIDAVEAAS